ncbi:MAG: SCO family protein [Hyphomicrobiales bacterium]
MMRPAGLVMALLGIALLAVSWPSDASAELDVRNYKPGKPVAGFALADHRKRPFTPESFKGKWTMVLLGYTHCPDVCPFTLNNLAVVHEQLKSQLTPDSLPQIVFVGVDPDRDAAVMAGYITHFDPDFLGVTGEWPQIRIFVEAVEGFARLDKKKPDDEGYLVRHSSRVSIIDPDGRMVAQVNPPLPPAETAMFVAGLMRAHRKESALAR